eukprot:6231657-Ditylum_brightwellii.AAC.1
MGMRFCESGLQPYASSKGCTDAKVPELLGEIIGGDPISNHIHNKSTANFTKTILVLPISRSTSNLYTTAGWQIHRDTD